MPIASYRMGGTSLGDVAFFAGDSRDPSNNLIVMYNVTSNTWTTRNISQPRYSPGATSLTKCGGIVIFAGGYVFGVEEPSNAVDIYHASSNTWTTTTLS